MFRPRIAFLDQTQGGNVDVFYDISKHYELCSDVFRCRYCDRPQHVSHMGKPFQHDAECRYNGKVTTQDPWGDLFKALGGVQDQRLAQVSRAFSQLVDGLDEMDEMLAIASGGMEQAEEFIVLAGHARLWAQGSEPTPTSRGVSLIAAERLRQVEEKGFTQERDAGYTGQELAWAATYYAIPEAIIVRMKPNFPVDNIMDAEITVNPDLFYPAAWLSQYANRNKETRLRELVVAGALLAAEIDRILAAGEE